MKPSLAVLLPFFFSQSLWSQTGELTACGIALQKSAADVVEHLAEESIKNAKKLQHWTELTSADKESAINRALTLIDEYGKLTKKRYPTEIPAVVINWRKSAHQVLTSLNNTAQLLQAGINELTQILQNEAAIIQQAQNKMPSPEAQTADVSVRDHSLKFLTMRESSMHQVLAALKANLQMIPSLYAKILNRYDLTLPLLEGYEKDWVLLSQNPLGMNSKDNNPSPNTNQSRWVVESVRREDGTYEARPYIDNFTSSYYRLHRYTELTATTKNRLKITPLQQRLSDFIFPVEQQRIWIERSQPLLNLSKDPSLMIGQKILLRRYPNSKSPINNFLVQGYNATSQKVKLQLPTGFSFETKLDELVAKQLRLIFFEQVESRLSQDQPTMILTGQYGRYDAGLITAISMDKRSVRILGLEDSTLESQWIRFSKIAGFPVQLDTNINPAAVNSISTPIRLGMGVTFDAISSSSDKMRVFTLEAIRRPKNQKLHIWQSATPSLLVNNQNLDELLALNRSGKSPERTASPIRPTVGEFFGNISSQLEGNLDLLVESRSHINQSRHETTVLQVMSETLAKREKDIRDFETPGFKGLFGRGADERQRNYKEARDQLQSEIISAKTILNQNLTLSQDAVQLARHLVDVTKRYQLYLAQLQLQKPSQDQNRKDLLTDFLQERLSSINHIAQLILNGERQYKAAKENLTRLLAEAEKTAQRLQLPKEEYPAGSRLSSARYAYEEGASRDLLPLTAGGVVPAPLISNFFASKPQDLTKRLGASLEDFKVTMTLNKWVDDFENNFERNDWEGSSLTLMTPQNISVTYKISKMGHSFSVFDSTESVDDAATESEWNLDSREVFHWVDQRRQVLFHQELSVFLEKHGGLYTQLIDSLIIGNSLEKNSVSLISRQGLIASVEIKELPIIFERLPENTGVRSQEELAFSSMARGITYKGESIYLLRNQGDDESPLYYTKMIDRDFYTDKPVKVEWIQLTPSGIAIKDTNLLGNTEYLLIDLMNKGEIFEAIRSQEDPDTQISLSLSQNKHTVLQWVRPIGTTGEDSVVMRKISRGDEWEVTFSKSQLSDYLALPVITPDETISSYLQYHLKKGGRRAHQKQPKLVYLPDSFLPGGILVTFDQFSVYLIKVEDLENIETTKKKKKIE